MRFARFDHLANFFCLMARRESQLWRAGSRIGQERGDVTLITIDRRPNYCKM